MTVWTFPPSGPPSGPPSDRTLGCSGEIRDEGGLAVARLSGANLLGGDVPGSIGGFAPLAAQGCRAVVVFSGWYGAPVAPADGSFPEDPRVWMGGGRVAMDAALEGLCPEAGAAGIELWLRPHARHVLSDGPSCRAALDRWSEGDSATFAPRLLLDPVAMLTGSMAESAAEHTARVLEMTVGHARTAGVIVGPAPGGAATWREAVAEADGSVREALRTVPVVVGDGPERGELLAAVGRAG